MTAGISEPSPCCDHPTIWCGVPVYNNAATVFKVARKCRDLISHVLVIDDGSTDADLRELLKPLDVKVIRHSANQGKGAALLTAFAYAAEHGAEYLITLDGDGQHFPEDIPRFVSQLSPDQILIGERREITGDMPRSSRFGRQFSDFWIYIETGEIARDTQSGFRAYPLRAMRQLQLNARFYNFEMEIVTKALWAGLGTRSVPIRVWYPPAAQRVSSFEPLRDNWRISLLHTRLVLRQLLPLPHRQLPRTVAKRRWSNAGENSGPLGLAVVIGLSLLMAIVLWPWGIFAIAYVTIRLHLNKIVAAACAIACMPSVVPDRCLRIGRTVVGSHGGPRLQWIIGAHLVAVPIAIIAACAAYLIARRFAGADGERF